MGSSLGLIQLALGILMLDEDTAAMEIGIGQLIYSVRAEDLALTLIMPMLGGAACIIITVSRLTF